MKYSPDLFTLSHDDVMLHDNMTLADLCKGENGLFLQIHSFVVMLRCAKTSGFSKCTLVVTDFRDPKDVIAAFLFSMYAIDPFKVKFYSNSSTKRTQLQLEDYQVLVPGQKVVWDTK